MANIVEGTAPNQNYVERPSTPISTPYRIEALNPTLLRAGELPQEPKLFFEDGQGRVARGYRSHVHKRNIHPQRS